MKKIRLKKWVLIVLVVLIILIGGSIGLYFFGLTGFKEAESVTFTVQPGASKIEIVDDLKSAGLIRSKTVSLLYLLFHKDISLQAGQYTIARNMDVPDILDKMNKGDIDLNTVTITFVEGKNMNDYMDLISTKLAIPKEDIKAVLEDKEFIKSLVEKYDFLTDEILNDNIYYALEGYLFPDTYEFLEDISVQDLIIKILDHTKTKLADLEINNGYTLHQVLTMASIVELEAVDQTDREKVAQVIYKRLEMGKGLGMDVTTYYAVQKTLGEELTMNDLKSINYYNTSESNPVMTGKLPIGPICNPSLESIEAVLHPSATDYMYFYANIMTHEVFFANTYEEFIEIQRNAG